MEGMVNDLQLAKEKHTVFEDWRRAGNKKLPCDLHVNVLTYGFWPQYQVYLNSSFPSHQLGECQVVVSRIQSGVAPISSAQYTFSTYYLLLKAFKFRQSRWTHHCCLDCCNVKRTFNPCAQKQGLLGVIHLLISRVLACPQMLHQLTLIFCCSLLTWPCLRRWPTVWTCSR